MVKWLDGQATIIISSNPSWLGKVLFFPLPTPIEKYARHARQIGSSPQVGVEIKNVCNHLDENFRDNDG